MDKNDITEVVVDKQYNEVIEKAIKGSTKRAWESLMEMHGISNTEGCCYKD